MFVIKVILEFVILYYRYVIVPMFDVACEHGCLWVVSVAAFMLTLEYLLVVVTKLM